MYHPSVPCPANDLLLSVFSWTTTFVPGGAIGVVLKSKLPSSAAYADNDRLRRAGHNKLIIILPKSKKYLTLTDKICNRNGKYFLIRNTKYISILSISNCQIYKNRAGHQHIKAVGSVEPSSDIACFFLILKP